MAKKIELRQLNIENFKGITKLSASMGKRTVISGQNGTGKTTIADAFMWLMFGKNFAGEADFAIRPSDKSGKRVDNIIIRVGAVLEVDGEEITLTKTQEQNWVKKRGNEVAELQGNNNNYEISDIPKTEKDYKAYINNLIEEKLFKLITNSRAFVSLKWKEQRDVLMELVTELTDADIIETDAKFKPLAAMLEKASVDDLVARTRKALKELKKTQDELPSRIDEANHAIVVVDLTEEEQRRSVLMAQIAEVERQLDHAAETGEAIAILQDDIRKTQLELGRVADKANESIVNARREIQIRKSNADSAFAMAMQKHANAERDLGEQMKLLEDAKRNREELLDHYKEVLAMEMDPNAFTCPMCGKALPGDQKEKQRGKFEGNKLATLADIVERGKKSAANIQRTEERIKELAALIEEYKAEKVRQNGLSAGAETELRSLPESADLTENDEYQTLTVKLAERKKQLSESDTGAGYRTQLREKRAGLQAELDEVNRRMGSIEANERARARIVELEKEQRTVAQRVAKQEQGLFLLEEFTKAKMGLLSSKINSKFKLVNFRLFEGQINGGFKEACECMISGVGFADLSNGQKMMAGLDVISALQGIYGMNALVFVDNTESINDFNIPVMDCQTIMMKVTDHPKLSIEGGSFHE